MSTSHPELTKLLCSLEERLLDPAVRQSSDALDELLAEEFIEFGSSGRTYSRDEIVAALRTEERPALSLHDLRCVLVAAGVALVTYRSSRAVGDGTRESLRSSLWVYRSERWQMIFHQGTGLPDALSSS